MRRRGELRGDSINYAKALLEVTGKYYYVPRKYNTEKSMTRYFSNEFMNVDDFMNINSSDALVGEETLDGKVITLFSFGGIKQEAINKHLLDLADKRLVVVCPKKGLKAKKQLKEYEIIREIREDTTFTSNNEILKKELPLLLDDLSLELETLLDTVYKSDAETRVLYFDGEKIRNVKAGNEEIAVNECCYLLYPFAPEVNNEMVNRALIGTAQTKKARLNIIQAILSHVDTPDFYVGSNQEATVYRSLFTVTNVINGDTKENIKRILDQFELVEKTGSKDGCSWDSTIMK